MTSTRGIRSTAIFVTGMLLLAACDAQINISAGERGSGTLVTETFDVEEFTSISVQNAFDVVIEVGEAQAVAVLVDDNFVDDLDVRVRNGELQVGVENGFSFRNGTFEATVQVPSLEGLDVSGASVADVSGLDETELELDVSGASDVVLEGRLDKLTVDASGASSLEVNVDGLDEVILDASGASSVEIAEVRTVRGDLSGASDLSVPVATTVNVDTSGASEVSRS